MPTPKFVSLSEFTSCVLHVVNYNYDDERDDYVFNCSDEPGGNQRRGHVFESLRTVREFLTGQVDPIDYPSDVEA